MANGYVISVFLISSFTTLNSSFKSTPIKIKSSFLNFYETSISKYGISLIQTLHHPAVN